MGDLFKKGLKDGTVTDENKPAPKYLGYAGCTLAKAHCASFPIYGERSSKKFGDKTHTDI